MPQCLRCKVHKIEEDFDHQPLHEDKLLKWCKLCIEKQKDYRKNNIEKDKTKQQKYYKKNKEKIIKVRERRFNTVEGRLKKILSNIKNHEENCDLDIEYLLALNANQNGRCALTKIEMVYNNDTDYRSHPFMISIDRLNNNFEHIKGNVRLVCIAVNMALNEFGEDVFRQICEAYIKTQM